MKDVVVLVPDKNTEYAVRGLLGRHQSLRIRPLSQDIFVHPHRDPGCLNEAHDFLRPFAAEYDHALVMFDHEGCGREGEAPDTLGERVRGLLRRNGWMDRADVVVLAPELEAWVWSSSPHVEACLGWAGRQPSLRKWLAANGYWPAGHDKPPCPKEAMEAALGLVHEPRSSSIYLQLASRVSLRGHSEPAFLYFTQTLERWFAP